MRSSSEVTICTMLKGKLSLYIVICYREMGEKLSRKDKELGNVQQKLIEAVEEEKTIAEEKLRNSQADRRHMMNGHVDNNSDEEDTHRGMYLH
jgi:hypothetical protein